MTMVIDQEMCNGCGACLEACPNGAIAMSDGKAVVDQARCSFCQACVDVCPAGAIQVTKSIFPVSISNPGARTDLQPHAALESSKGSNWSGELLTLTGRYVLPRFVDILATFLELRLGSLLHESPLMTIGAVEHHPYRQRRRNRGRCTGSHPERR